MWRNISKRAVTVAAVAALSFGAVACDGGVDVEEDPGEEAPLGGTEDPIKETPTPGSS